MKRLIEFSGIPSGDCECFCWEVDQETYKRITGCKPGRHDRGKKRGMHRLYPDDIIGNKVFQDGLPLKFKVLIDGKKH